MRALPTGLKFFERGWLSSNNVLLHDDAQAILIDTGYWTHATQTAALVTEALGSKPLTAIINTHLHSDHCGGNAHLQARFPDLSTYIPPGHAAYVDQWDAAALTYTPTGQHCPPFVKTAVLHDGDQLSVADQTWRIHAAPGHDPHSIIVFNAQDRILISADALWENGFGVVFPEIEGISAFHEIEATLQVIEALNPTLVLPGHGSAFEDVTGALARARSRLAQFRKAPDKHSAYAAKVLLKFKLLEWQKVTLEDFYAWAHSVHYLHLLHASYAKTSSFETWLFDLSQSLEKSGACAIEGDWVMNR